MESWKEIAAYLKRDVRTVQRWEKREGLPVHRHIHDKMGSVYAFPGELDAWRNSRGQQAAPRNHQGRLGYRALEWLAAAAILALGVLAFWLFRGQWRLPPAQIHELAARRVWAGPDADRLGTVSPDGRYLAFSDSANRDLAVREIATGTQRGLLNSRAVAGEALSPTFSPNGRQIAYAWLNEANSYDLRVIEADGSHPRVLYRNGEVHSVQIHDWSPDGRSILAVLYRKDNSKQMALVNVADGSVRVLKTFHWRAPLRSCFSPDGRYVAFDLPQQRDSSDHDIFVLAADSGGDSPLVEHPANDFLLGWAPDGKTVLFVSDRSGTFDAWALEVSDGKAQGAPRLVRKDLGRIWPVGFTRSGSYYYGLQTGMTDVYVTRIDPVTGKILSSPVAVARRYVGANRSPDWSPDGRSLAYVRQRLPAARWPEVRIVVQPVEGDHETEVRPQLLMVDLVRWSADGRAFLATGHDYQYCNGLFRVDAHTGQTVPILRGQEPRDYFHEPAWVSNGRILFYKVRAGATEPARLFRRDLASGREEQFLSSVYRFSISPDGQRLAFSTFDSRLESIHIIPVSRGEPRAIFSQRRGTGRIRSLAWIGDGAYLLFARKGELWRIPAGGGEPQIVLSGMEDLRDLRVHPDGQRIAFTAGAGRGELWVIENILPGSRVPR